MFGIISVSFKILYPNNNPNSTMLNEMKSLMHTLSLRAQRSNLVGIALSLHSSQ